MAILTIGLLGMAGLQGFSIASSYNAHLRTQATALAQSIIDRMRANRDQAISNGYVINFGNNPPTGTTDCTTTACTAAQMRNLDLLEWKCSLGNFVDENFCSTFATHSSLPAGDGEIITETNGQVRVTVRWSDTAGETHQVMLFTDL